MEEGVEGSDNLPVLEMRKNSRHHDEESLHRSRDLRTNMSVSEKVLWDKLKDDKLGFRFRRQVRVAGYYLDFYCAKAALCIEVDGDQPAERIARDAIRDRVLKGKKIETLRIPSLDLFEESGKLHHWVQVIFETCDAQARARTSLHPQPPPPFSDPHE